MGALFLGGVVPGLMMAGSLMVMVMLVAKRFGLPAGRRVPLSEMPAVLGRALIPMTLPVVLLGGLFSGVFTPTEAAAVAALYAIVLGTVVYRAMGVRTLAAVMLESARQSTVVMLLIASAFVINYAVTAEHLALNLANTVRALELSPLGFLLVVNVMFLVLGCFLDASVMLLVFVPVLLPTARALGIDLVHFGVVVIVNFMIGLITPPYGLLLFVLSALAKLPFAEVARDTWIFVLPLIVVLLLLVLFPELVLFLPRRLGFLQ